MKRLVFTILAAACLLTCPATASAQSDFIDWLNGLSGPGPFHTRKPLLQSVNLRAACIKEDGAGGHRVSSCLLDDMDDRIKVLIGVSFSWTPTVEPRFTGATATDPLNAQPINASRIEVSYSYRVGPMIDVGIGAGALIFSGDGFTNQVHPIITPVQFTFYSLGFLRKGKGLKWGRVLRLRFSDRYVIGDINARTDFGSTSSYLTHGEFNPSFSVGLDLLPLFAKGR